MLIDIQAIRQAVKNKAATTGDVATAATNQPKNRDFVATVTTVASRHGVEAASPPPASSQSVATVAASPRVESAAPLSVLLALADRYCTAIQASDKARQDWHADIEATPPNDRQGLAQYLRGELAKLVPPVAPKPAPPLVTPAKPMPKFSVSAPWRAADSAWLAHWGQCPECKTAGRTNTPRCTQGEALFTTYQQAVEVTKESK